MAQRPSFKGFRSPDGTRSERNTAYSEMIQEFGFDPVTSSFAKTIDDNRGELGQAWDCVMETLTNAISNAVIAKNPTCVELLEIVRSIASTVDAREGIDDVLGVLQPVFQAQIAFQNKLVSQGKYDEARFWMLDDLEKSGGRGGKSKNQVANAYVFKIKEKFGLKVSPDTIARNWL